MGKHDNGESDINREITSEIIEIDPEIENEVIQILVNMDLILMSPNVVPPAMVSPIREYGGYSKVGSLCDSYRKLAKSRPFQRSYRSSLPRQRHNVNGRETIKPLVNQYSKAVGDGQMYLAKRPQPRNQSSSSSSNTEEVEDAIKLSQHEGWQPLDFLEED